MFQHKHIISFSGGAASFATAVEVIERHGKENVVLVFCDTLIEDEDLYRFIDEAAEKLEVPLIKLCKGETPWEVFKRKKYQGNTRTAHCTVELKGKMFARWLYANHRADSCTIYFGFDWNELHRLETARGNWHPFKCEAPLSNPPFVSRQQIFNTLDDYDIEVPRLYKMGFTHNNCGGFCVKAGQGHFANLLNKMPERYAEHEDKQEQLMRELPTARPFLRMTVNRKLEYLTLKQYREYLQNGGVFINETGGCNCFSDTEAKGIIYMLESEDDELS